LGIIKVYPNQEDTMKKVMKSFRMKKVMKSFRLREDVVQVLKRLEEKYPCHTQPQVIEGALWAFTNLPVKEQRAALIQVAWAQDLEDPWRPL